MIFLILMFYINLGAFKKTSKSLIRKCIKSKYVISDDAKLFIKNRNHKVQRQIASKIHITISAEKEFFKNTILAYKRNMENEIKKINTISPYLLGVTRKYQIENELIIFFSKNLALIVQIENLFSRKLKSLVFLFEKQIKNIIYSYNIKKNTFLYLQKRMIDIVMFLTQIPPVIVKELHSNLDNIRKVAESSRNNSIVEFTLYFSVNQNSMKSIMAFYNDLIKILNVKDNQSIQEILNSKEVIIEMFRSIAKYSYYRLLETQITKQLTLLIDFKNLYT